MLIGYERCSTTDQHPEVQGDRLRAAGCERIYSDAGESGRKASRPEWDRCLEHLRAGDTLVCVRLDRMGRSVRNLIDVMVTLKERGVNVRILDQAIDTGTPAGRFFFHVLASLAEMEADLLRERTLDGLAHAASQGRHGGRRPKLSEAQVAQVRLMDESGMSVPQIMEIFPQASRATIYRAIGTAAA
jgi:DNA invertase Pin-like site-specific DNA recombinase